MPTILKISEAASIALHTMALLAAGLDRPSSVKALASDLQVSEHHLSKVLQRLVRVRLVRSARGPRGGFSIVKKPEHTTLLEIYEAIDGPLEMDNCLLSKHSCIRNGCLFGDLLQSVNGQVHSYLAGKFLSDLVTDRGEEE